MSEIVVLDLLPRGYTDDERGRYERSPVAFAVGVEDFALYELRLVDDADVSIDDRIDLDHDAIEEANEVDHAGISGGAQSELEYVVAEIVERDAERFLEFYEEAGPVTLRRHQLDLLPGVGETIRDGILDARKRGGFDSFADLEERVDGLHDPEGTVVERILAEIRDEDLKYHLFATAHAD
jgi:putative nucleotide binding protein